MAKPKQEYVFLKIPVSSWDVMEETLTMDAQSRAFDPDLRRKIQSALKSVELLQKENHG